ncbi:phosphosulfolactate synthase [Thermanaerosceptrum fracticalcis]
MMKSWQGIIHYPLGERGLKPRRSGITMVIDKGLGMRELKDLLEVAGNYLDFLKLGFGTPALYSEEYLKAKIDLCRKYDVKIYPGGTFMEVALLQGRYEAFLTRIKELGFNTIEISDGTITLDHKIRQYCIKRAAGEGLTVLTELGKKDAKVNPDISDLLKQADHDLAAGAWKVIMEARESGKGIGIYDMNGEILEEKLEDFIMGIGDLTSIIWEAPLKNQQVEMITRFGSDVNLGNIQPNELMSLEALRTGLRGDTLRLVLRQQEAAIVGK